MEDINLCLNEGTQTYNLRHKHRDISLATQRLISAETHGHVLAETQRQLKAQTPNPINGNGIAGRAEGENLPRSGPK